MSALQQHWATVLNSLLRGSPSLQVSAAAGQQTVKRQASSNGTGSFSAVQQQSRQSQPTTVQQQIPRNEPASSRANGSAPAYAQRQAQSRSNGNGASGNASSSATATVEGWVSENLTAFLSDPASGPDLPMSSSTSNSGAPAVQQQNAQQQQQQQQPQQQQQQSQQQLQQQQSVTGRGANGVTVEARQAWGSVKQEGPAGAWQGSGQGRNGGSGGSWAHVDDRMEDARRFLSPWRCIILSVSSLHCTPAKQRKRNCTMHSSNALL